MIFINKCLSIYLSINKDMRFQQKHTCVTTYNDQILDYNQLEKNLYHFHEISRNSPAPIFLSHLKLYLLNLLSIYINFHIFMKFQQKYTYATEHNDQISDYHRLKMNLSHFHEISRKLTAFTFLSHSKVNLLNLHSIYKNFTFS